MIDINLILI